MEKNIWNNIISIRKQSPLVHNITNFVVMNNTANALLAIGASPIMAHAQSEISDIVKIAHSVVINIGTLDEYWSETMMQAAHKANMLNKPWVLDPVGAGASSFRDTILQQLLKLQPTVIRGNASEIIALAQFNKTATKGVDSTSNSNDALAAAKLLARQYNSVICISGATDIVTNNTDTFYIENGHALMTKVTGLGCTASALIGAFIGAVDNVMEATAAAMTLLGIAGELAEKESQGPGSLQVKIIDKLYNMTEQEFYTHLKIEKQ